ncbi:MAG: glycosyl hydrolase [Phycisphaerae bacterium]|nr:glycosyl hydrolase [Phycisphaerae bacterium]
MSNQREQKVPKLFFTIFAAVLPIVVSLCRADVDSLQQSFQQPPDDARIMVRWWWFGPAVTKPGLEREMRLMKEGGIGGFEVQPTYPLAVDDERPGLKNLTFLSPEFLDAVRFTAEKAKELGLRMDLTLGSGWPYGGPQFPAGEGAGRLLTQVVQVAAGQKSVPAPALREGQSLIAAFAGKGNSGLSAIGGRGRGVGSNAGKIDVSTMKEIPIRSGAAGLAADAPDPAEVVFFIAGRTGMQVKRPALGAEGNVIDHYSPQVVDKFIRELAEPVIKACGPNPPYALFCDSLEVGGEDWTDNLFVEFQKRRGYDLRSLLPALIGDVGPGTADIRHDWGRTLTEMFNDNFNVHFAKLAKDSHSRFRIQGYGSPSAGLFSYAYMDLPEGEGDQWHGYRTTRWASSASHLMGVPVTSAESFTWLHSPVFRATPLDVKAEADTYFLQGVNQIICHGWPYTAEGAEYPGWSFYAAAVFNEKNPWWIVMPDVSLYLQRLSHVLRQGTPANDIALYLANSDAWAGFVPGRISLSDAVGLKLGPDIIPAILDSGYNLDFFDDGMLDLHGKVENGTLAFGDLRYKVVVLAGVERIEAATMQKLKEFAAGGGTVIATRRLPDRAPGYRATGQDTQAVRDTAQYLFKGPNAPGLFIADESQLGPMLAQKLAPDMTITPASPEIGFVHRHRRDAEVYFLANTANQRKSVKLAFRVGGMQAEVWDPMTGRVGPAGVAEKSVNATTVSIALEPYGSTLIVFTNRALPVSPKAPAVAFVPGPLDLSSNWTVRFGKDAQPVVMDKLVSWTEDPATKDFSGVATYEKAIDVAPEMLKDGLSLSLSLGQALAPGDGDISGRGGSPRFAAALEAPVREAAVVYVNDQRVGSIWAPPYAIDVTGKLKPGENAIRIEAANLAVNYMVAHGYPNYNLQGVRKQFGNRFDPQDLNQLRALPSGLLGPIQLVATAKASQ